jgi:hypothetical protein
MTLKEAWDTIQTINQELRPFEQKSPVEQYRLAEVDPTLGARKLKADLMREAVFDILENRGVEGIPQARGEYAALAQMRNAFYRNIVRAEKSPPKLLRGGWRSSPLFWSLASSGAVSVAGLPPALTVPVGASVGIAAEISRFRGRPNRMVARGVKRLAKSELEPMRVQYPPFSSGGGGTPTLPPFFPQRPVGGNPISPPPFTQTPADATFTDIPPFGTPPRLLGSGQKLLPPSASTPRGSQGAEFLGYQKVRGGQPFPLFNINIPGHPLNGSTVSAQTLMRLGIPVPQAPPL